MTHTVLLAPLAVQDLIDIGRWIGEQADHAVAQGYLDRVEQRIAALSHYPDRGTPREDFGAGVRTLTFERRLIIAYVVARDTVTVLRVVHAHRALGPLFGG